MMIFICFLASVTLVFAILNVIIVCCFSDTDRELEDKEQEEYLRKWREEHPKK